MALAFQSIDLDAGDSDTEGTLVFRKGALLAVVSKLGAIHGELAGLWFVEATFHPQMRTPRQPFADLAAVNTWLCQELD